MNLKNRHRIADMARVNLDETEHFPSGEFKLEVEGREGNKPPHFHVINTQEGYKIKVTTVPTLMKVVNPGKRGRNDQFVDEIKEATKWLPKPPADADVAAKFSSNREYIEFQYKKFNPK